METALEQIPLENFLFVSAVIFTLGIYGVLTRRNAIMILMSVELMLNAVAVNFVAFNHYRFGTEISVVSAQDPIPAGAVQVQEGSFGLSELAPSFPSALAGLREAGREPKFLRYPAVHGMVFTIFIIVLAAAEAAVALAIFLNYYNNFSSVDVEKADELKG